MGLSVSGWRGAEGAPARRSAAATDAGGLRRAQNGTGQLLAFLRTKGESQADWEALLNDFYRRGLKGDKLLLVVTDGCPGLAAALQTVYPRVAHQRCWLHKMRNILDK